MKEVVRSACRTALLEAGFTPDDYFMDLESPSGMYGGQFYTVLLYMQYGILETELHQQINCVPGMHD